jgi:hypothetical protein
MCSYTPIPQLVRSAALALLLVLQLTSSPLLSEWVSGDRTNIVQWEYGVFENVSYHKMYRQTQLLFSEINDQAEWGDWYWTTDNVANLTYQSGQDIVVRGNFSQNGKLQNTQDTNYRAIQTNWPVFAYAIDLGSVGESEVSTLFSLGLIQEQAIQFNGTDGVVSLPSLWTNYFPNDLTAVWKISHMISDSANNPVFLRLGRVLP